MVFCTIFPIGDLGTVFMENLVQTIVRKVAEQKNVDPLDIEKPLYEAIDVDGLESVINSNSATVSFTYIGYQVTVSSDSVEVSPKTIYNGA